MTLLLGLPALPSRALSQLPHGIGVSGMNLSGPVLILIAAADRFLCSALSALTEPENFQIRDRQPALITLSPWLPT